MKKSFLIAIVLLLLTVTVFINTSVFAADSTLPTVTISGIASDLVIEEGGTLTFKIYFDDETELASTYMVGSSIITNGFTATKTITGGTTKTVTLSNIKGSGTGKSITINAGAATDSSGNTSLAATSRTFTIEAVDSTPPTVSISKANPTSVYIGETVTYTVYFDDETAVDAVNFSSSSVTLNGFTASVSVSGTGKSQRTVTLTNVQGTADSDNYIIVNAGVATDTSGNTSRAASSATFTMSTRPVVDSLAPTVTVSSPSPYQLYIGGTVKYTIYFDDETAIKAINFNSNYVTLNGFTADVSVSGTGNTRVLTLANVQGGADSNNYITVKEGAVTDTSGNISNAVTSARFKMIPVPDTTVPTVTISSPSPSSLYIGGTVTYTVYFDDETAIGTVNFNSNYVTLNGFTANVSVSGTGNAQRTVTLTNVQGAADADNYITVKAGAVADTSGNTSSAASSAKFTMEQVPDTTVPTVTISSPSPSSLYIGGTVTYTVYFDDETAIGTVNFNSNYVTLNGFTANVSVSGTGNAQRTVTLTNVQGAADSDNYIIIKAGVVTDTSGNTSRAVSSTKFTMMTIPDTTVPTVTISAPNPKSVYAGGTVTYTVYFDDETEIKTVNFNSNSVTLNGFTADITVSGSGKAQRTVTLTNVQGSVDSDNCITVKGGVVTDTSGNTSKAVTSDEFTIAKVPDTTVPTVTISSPSPESVYIGDTVTYIVYFSDETAVDTVSFNSDYVTLNGFTANVSVSGTGNSQRTVTLTNVKGEADSDNYITVKAGAVTDTSGNTSKAATSAKFTMKPLPDTTVPTVTISRPTPTSIYEGETVTYTVYFDDETAIKAVNFDKTYVRLNGFTANVSVSGTGNSQRIVTLTNIQGTADSDNYITVKTGAVIDTSGNLSKEVTSINFTIVEKPVVDSTVPTVTISKPNPTSLYAGETVIYTVYFADETAIKEVNFNSNSVTLNGFTADITVSGSGNAQRTVTLSNIQSEIDTNNYITVKAGVVTDTSGNNSKAVNSTTFAVVERPDTTIPTVTISKPNPASIYAGETVQYIVYFNDERAIRSINFNASYVELNGFTANVRVSDSGNSQRTITLTNVQGIADSDNYITVKAGAVADTSGNVSKAVSSETFEIKETPDTTIPTVTIDKANPVSIYAGETVRYIVRFSDETELGIIHFDSSYVQLYGFTASISVTGTGNTRTVTLTNVQGEADANNYIIVKAGAAEDAAGNKTKEAASLVFTIKEKEPEEEKDTIPPVVKISEANPKVVYEGETVKYTVTFSDNIKVTDVKLDVSKIQLIGFEADVSVKVNGTKSAEITLKNIKGNVGINKYIKISSGVALDEPGNRSAEAISLRFAIDEKASEVNKKPTETKYTLNCIDDLAVLGDINKEITYFASWLRAEKYTAMHVQENNYVAEDETMTYMVEYYNGSTLAASNVSFDLTIPYKVDIEEINGNGRVTKRTDDETVITWNIGTVPSYASAKGYCRLYVRVKFLENEILEESDNISEVFYATLKTTANGNDTYSYMRQLFIAKTEGKIGTYESYLTMVDTTNGARPDDEITRAELAKLLADARLLDVKVGSKDYEKFEDSEIIPAYARDAVSALANMNIMTTFSDGMFKPNNPVLMEDAMQTIAQVAAYISSEKLEVYKPVFLYTDALIGRDEKVSPKKDYIMELMRQNIVVKYESNPDLYALRKDVVKMVNSLTFRGPFVETLPEHTLKFADIRDDRVFFYNIVGALNSYKYTYDYRLWQQVVEVAN